MRFYSVDPAEEQARPYTYCANNPVMFTDPSGCFERLSVKNFSCWTVYKYF
ncbi:MAG TPA: RHS repeat-associated core domain-containing protein [Candidatus Cloacimonadota bacterium]|nr:RHS repeat-associated core domain-containing protein [Candidatus Cloacimonadota bacterium]